MQLLDGPDGGVIRLLLGLELLQPDLGEHELLLPHELAQLLELLLKVGLFLFRVLFQYLQLRLRALPELVRVLAVFDDRGHLFLLLMQLALQLLVDSIEDHSLSPVLVNLSAQIAVLRHRLVELHQVLLEFVLQQSNLLRDKLVVDCRCIHSSEP